MSNGLKLFNYIDGVNDTPFPNEKEQAVLYTYTVEKNRMGSAPSIEVTIMHKTCLDKLWNHNVYTEFLGEKYFVKYTPSATIDSSDGRYKHEITLLSEREILDNVYFIDAVQGDSTQDIYKSNSTEVIFYGDITEMVKRLNAAMEYAKVPYSVVIDKDITSEEKQVNFSDMKLSEVLQEIFNIYELPYYFVDKVIHIGYTENVITHLFKYGVNDGLLSISKQNANYAITNRCTGTGSSDNIPFYYPNPSNDREAIEAEGGTWITPMSTLMPPIYRESNGAERYYNAKNNTYPSPDLEGEYYTFENEYSENNPHEHIVSFENIKPTIKGATNASGQRMDMFLEIAFDKNDNDRLNDNDEYQHPYFYVKLPKYNGNWGFNLFEHAIVDNNNMTISMTSGHCGACNFEIMVDEETQKNVLQVDSNGNLIFDEEGKAVFGTAQDRQNDTINNEVWIALKKDINTYGIIMPNWGDNIRPTTEDTFVILYIDLPQAYISRAENELKEAIIKYMANNNMEKFTFSIDFSRIFFAKNPDILALLNENARLSVEYDGEVYTHYVSSFKYSMEENAPLPKITVELAETLSAGSNSFRNTIDAVKQDIMNSVGSIDFLKQGLKYFIRKDVDDYARGYIRFLNGLFSRYIQTNKIESEEFIQGTLGNGFTLKHDTETGKSYLEVDEMYIRLRAIFNELQIKQTTVVGGEQILSPASMRCIKVEEAEMPTDFVQLSDNSGILLNDVNGVALMASVSTAKAYRCYFKQSDGEKTIYNQFAIGDLAMCRQFNIQSDTTATKINRYYWRKVVGLGDDYIVLSVDDCMEGSDIPNVGDDISTVGNESDTSRQNVIILSSYADDAPSIKLYEGINTYSFANKDVIVISPKGNKFQGDFILTTGKTVEQEIIDANTRIDGIANDVEDVNNFANQINEQVKDLQTQIDGVIEIWFYDPVPTLTNEPAVNWTTDEEKDKHLGDVYYDANGAGYRFEKRNGVYRWAEITDSAALEALEAAKKAQDTADSKRRIFVSQPTYEQAYDVGDLWVNATYGGIYNNDLLRCVQSKTANSYFNISHWDLASKYTDDTVANEAKQDAASAQEAADNAAKEAQDAKNRLDSWAEDGVISPTEKLSLKDEIVRIDADKVEIANGYEKYSMGTPTDFNNAHIYYRDALVSLTASTPENIPIPSDFEYKQQTYYDARTTALNNIAIAAKNYVSLVVSGEIEGIRTEFESQLKILADEISQRVTKTYYDANNTEIREQIGELSTRADEISATVTENTESIDGLNTQVGELSVKSDKISLSVSELQKGYVNYLLNSGNFKDTDKWNQAGNNGRLRVENGLLKYSVVDWNYAWGHISEQISPNLKWEDGATYTFSVRISANYTRDIKIGFRDANGAFYYVQTFNVGIGAKVCTYSFTYNASNHTNGKDITAFIIQTQTSERPSEGNLIVIKPSVNIYYTMLVKGDALPSEWTSCPDDLENSLVRTGIDIENRKIVLQADTTVIKNNDGEDIVIITEDGRLSADAIDTDTLVAKVVKTTEDGKRVEIFDNKLTMYDELGALKLVVSGDKLSEQPTGTSITIPENSKKNEGSGKDETFVSSEITLATINVEAENNIVTIPRTRIDINLTKEANNFGYAKVDMYLMLDDMLLIRAYAENRNSNYCTSTGTYIGGQMSLSKGTHTLKYKFSGFAYGDPYNINTTVTPSTNSVYVDYTQDLIEIAADGFRSSAGANNYLKHTASGTEIRCGNYGIKITSSGIQRMLNGTDWGNWQ